eukprot:1762036-Amphidinium_carterae.2
MLSVLIGCASGSRSPSATSLSVQQDSSLIRSSGSGILEVLYRDRCSTASDLHRVDSSPCPARLSRYLSAESILQLAMCLWEGTTEALSWKATGKQWAPQPIAKRLFKGLKEFGMSKWGTPKTTQLEGSKSQTMISKP